MPKFRKKPVEIEARRFICVALGAQNALADWCRGSVRGTSLPADERIIQIGEMEASFGDWIICEEGRFYPCKPDIFELTYYEV